MCGFKSTLTHAGVKLEPNITFNTKSVVTNMSLHRGGMRHLDRGVDSFHPKTLTRLPTDFQLKMYILTSRTGKHDAYHGRHHAYHDAVP